MKNIINRNSKFQYQGYQERYWDNKLSYRGNKRNDVIIGYTEWHYFKETNFHIK